MVSTILANSEGCQQRVLAGRLQRIVQGIDQLHRATGGLEEASRQSSAGACSQQYQTEQAATATQQMAYSAEAVARHAEEALQVARQANQQAGAGERVVRQTAEQIDGSPRMWIFPYRPSSTYTNAADASEEFSM